MACARGTIQPKTWSFFIKPDPGGQRHLHQNPSVPGDHLFVSRTSHTERRRSENDDDIAYAGRGGPRRPPRVQDPRRRAARAAAGRAAAERAGRARRLRPPETLWLLKLAVGQTRGGAFRWAEGAGCVHLHGGAMGAENVAGVRECGRKEGETWDDALRGLGLGGGWLVDD